MKLVSRILITLFVIVAVVSLIAYFKNEKITTQHPEIMGQVSVELPTTTTASATSDVPPPINNPQPTTVHQPLPLSTPPTINREPLLRVCNQYIIPPLKEIRVEIIEPQEGTMYQQGDTMVLRGYAVETKRKCQLDPNNLYWSARKMQREKRMIVYPLGAGNERVFNFLEPGRYTITAIYDGKTDALYARPHAEITIEVREKK